VRRSANGFLFIDGTPTDCVHIAVTGLLDHLPDMVVSGINLGANMGDDTIYSGTVAAATEGYLLGIPSIAVSLVGKEGRHFATAAQVARNLVERCSKSPPAARMLLNVNVPDVAQTEVQGTEVTRLGKRHKAEAVVRPPRRVVIRVYWIGAAGAAADAGPGTDFSCHRANRVSDHAAADRPHAQPSDATDRENGWPASVVARHRHDFAAHARSHDRAPARKGHQRRSGAGGDARSARHLFVEEAIASRAYEDTALPIGFGADHLPALCGGAHDRRAALR